MSFSPRSVLCVEDDRDTREFLIFLLTQAGYTVRAVGRGDAALTLAVSQKFDLYMIDNGLPDMTGIELCRQLRRKDSKTPILFFSGYVNAARRARAIGGRCTTLSAKTGQPGRVVK
jgi:DNA-binding response OmpR family regulator